MKQIIKSNFVSLQANIPDTLILPSIGNNDVIVHNNMECDDSLYNMYFNDLFNVWFEPQRNAIAYEQVKSTFTSGGYYRHDFPKSKTSVLVLNSILFKDNNKCKPEKAYEQLTWLAKQL